MTRTLLLADPSPIIQGLVERGLAAHDFDLICAGSGEDALDMARSRQPDLVLADVTLAGLDGYLLCEAIKDSSGLGDVPVLLLSGAFDRYDPERALASRADGHIQKPFESETLIDRVGEALAGAGTPLESSPGAALVGEELILADELDFEDESDLLEILPLPKEDQPSSDSFDDVFDFGDSVLETSSPSSEEDELDPGEATVPDVNEDTRGQFHDALREKAVEALSEYPEAVAEALIERVEAIAWEVIPQMAETLIREEIRRMKAGKE